MAAHKKIKSLAKFRKTYKVYLRNVPCYSAGGVFSSKPQVLYSTLLLVPGTTLVPGTHTIKVPVCDLILGYKKASYFFVFRVAETDHEAREIFFDLAGITSIPSWKLISRVGPNLDHHDSRLNLRCYAHFYSRGGSSGKKRISRRCKQAVRRVLSDYISSIGDMAPGDLICSIISGEFTSELKKKLEAHQLIGLDLIKETSIFEYLPPFK